MGSDHPLPEWASKPCIMGIDEAGRGPVLGPMVYGCLYCSRSYQKALSSLNFADSKTLKEKKREELFEILKADESIGWAVDVIDPRELSAKMLKKNKINLNEISHDSAIGLVPRGLNLGVLLTEVYVDTVGDPEKFQESRAYTSLSNPKKSDNEVHEVRPISQKVAKRKGKGKEKKEKNGESTEYLEIQSRKAAVLEKLVEIEAKKAEDKRITKYMDYLIMDTSYMTDQQKKDHERFCDHIRTNILKF